MITHGTALFIPFRYRYLYCVQLTRKYGQRTAPHQTVVLAKVRPLIPCEREVGMAVVSGRMRPRVPLDRCPANPRPLHSSGRLDAALLCSAALLLHRGFSRRGTMMTYWERLGSVGVAVGLFGCLHFGVLCAGAWQCAVRHGAALICWE